MTGLRKPATRLRWRIGTLLGAGVLVNYFDRISLAVAAPQLQTSFHLSTVDMGLLLSCFFWSYTLLQVPAGLTLDRYGVTTVGRWTALLWAAASFLAACASGYFALLAARIALGVAEAPSFPANAKATGYWFPRNERGISTALFDAAAKFSNVIGVPLIAIAVVYLGWRWGFGLVAVLSLLYFIVFYRVYRDPSHHPKLAPDERRYIRENGAVAEGSRGKTTDGMLSYLLSCRKVWGVALGFAAYGYCFYFFLTWLPGYLVQTLHLSILKSAGIAAIPWACATASDLLVGGWLIDWLIAKGRDESRVRTTVLLLGMTLGLAVFGATTATTSGAAVFWISLSLSGLAAAAPVGWSLPALVAPKGGTGTLAGIMNFGNNLMGAVAPIVTGFVIDRTQSFNSAFVVAGLVLIVGLASFAFLMGRVESIPEPAPYV